MTSSILVNTRRREGQVDVGRRRESKKAGGMDRDGGKHHRDGGKDRLRER